MNEIQARIYAIIGQKFIISLEEIKPETTLYLELGADSQDVLELILDLEDEFDIDIPESMAQSFWTVGQVVDSVISLINEK